MYAVFNNVTIREPVADIVKYIKYSKYPWYADDDISLLKDGIITTDESEADAIQLQESVNNELQELVIPLVEDVIPSGVEGQGWEDPGATATDALDGDLPVTVTNMPNIYAEGHVLVEYTATDSANQSATVTREVIVNTFGLLSLILKGSNLIIETGSTYIEPGYVAFDAQGNYIYDVTVSGSVDTAIEGVYTLTYSIALDNEERTVTRDVTVITTQD